MTGSSFKGSLLFSDIWTGSVINCSSSCWGSSGQTWPSAPRSTRGQILLMSKNFQPGLSSEAKDLSFSPLVYTHPHRYHGVVRPIPLLGGLVLRLMKAQGPCVFFLESIPVTTYYYYVDRHCWPTKKKTRGWYLLWTMSWNRAPKYTHMIKEPGLQPQNRKYGWSKDRSYLSYQQLR